jgi:hypothetical protein
LLVQLMGTQLALAERVSGDLVTPACRQQTGSQGQ